LVKKILSVAIHMNAIESLANLVRSIFENISKSTRLLVFIFSLLVLVLVFLYVESHTRLIYYYSLERKFLLLTELNQLANNGVMKNNELGPIYVELANEILNIKVAPMELPIITIFVIYKFLTGASFGLLFLVLSLIYRRPKAMRGALLVATFFGILAIFIPILGSIWVNLGVLVLAQLFLLIAVAPKKDPPTTPRTA